MSVSQNSLSRQAKEEKALLLQEKLRRKALADFLVFLTALVYIEDKENKCTLKPTWWPEQIRVVPQLVEEMLLILLKTRQVGLTWLAAALVLWLGIKHPLHLSVIISHGEDHAIEFLNRVYFILDRLPEWFAPRKEGEEVNGLKLKARTRQTLTFERDGMESIVKSMPTTEMGAESKTPNVLIIDEAHTIREVESIFNNSYPGIEQAKGQVIIIANSVKSGPGWGWVRDTYQKSMQALNLFARIFLSWTAHPGRPANFRALMVQSGMDEEDVKQHYPETEQEALASAAGSYFGNVLTRHNQTAPGAKGWLKQDKITKEIEFVEADRGIVEIWKYPYFLVKGWDEIFYERRYAIGDDVSEGLGESSSVAYVRDRLIDENVCRVRSNRLDAVEWAAQMDLLSQYYCNHQPATKPKVAEPIKSLICTEVTGAGQTTVKELIKRKCNQYVRVVPDKVGSGLTKQYGWTENNQSKHELCGDLKQWLRVTKGIVYDAVLLDECSTFIRFENGKLDHESGKRCDCVITAGLTEQASIFLGEGPKKITPHLTGWRAREADKKKEKTAWAA